MLFIEWWLVQRLLIGVLICAGAAAFFFGGRGGQNRPREVARSLAAPIGVLALLFVLLNIGAAGCQSYSIPIYSPDHQSAVRVRVANIGGPGGSTDVELFTARGFKTYSVFRGGWKTVEADDVKWVSDSELLVRYSGMMFGCESTDDVKVHCEPR